jgi:hypothetical protein
VRFQRTVPEQVSKNAQHFTFFPRKLFETEVLEQLYYPLGAEGDREFAGRDAGAAA